MRITRYMLVAITIISILGCASVQKTVSNAQPTAQLRYVSPKELENKFGANYEENPFIAPSTLLTGQPNDFLVLELRYYIPKPARVEVDATITGIGPKTARILNAAALKEYLAGYSLGTDTGFASANAKVRASILNRYCLPSEVYDANRGDHLFYIVIICPHLYPSGSRVVGRVFIDGEEFASIDEELPSK